MYLRGKGILVDHIFPRYGIDIIISLQVVLNICQFPRYLVLELGQLTRIALVIFLRIYPCKEHHSALSFLYPLLKCLASKVLYELIGILVRSHIDDPCADSDLPENCYDLLRRLHACAVTVVRQINLIGISLYYPSMSKCKCRSKGCHGIVKSCLMHGDDIHISLTAYKSFSPAPPCYVHGKQRMALVEHRSITGIYIFRFSIAHDSSAKCDDLAVYIQYRDHGSVPELVHTTFLLTDLNKSRALHLIICISLALQIPVQIIPVYI